MPARKSKSNKRGVRKSMKLNEFVCFTCGRNGGKNRVLVDQESMVRTLMPNGRYRLGAACERCNQRLSKFITADVFDALEGRVPEVVS